MTAPGFQALSQLSKTYQGLLIQTTQQAVEIAEAIQTAKILGTIDDGRSWMTNYPDGTPGWIVQLTIDGVLYTGYQFDWLVLDSENRLKLWHGASQWPGINPEFADVFQVPEIEWAATTQAPTAAARVGSATISFPQPTSSNAPFTYTVSQNDITANLTTEAVITSSSAGSVTVGDLSTGHEYTFEVIVNTAYAGVTATSLVTSAITAE
jgi:hypothetical protein